MGFIVHELGGVTHGSMSLPGARLRLSRHPTPRLTQTAWLAGYRRTGCVSLLDGKLTSQDPMKSSQLILIFTLPAAGSLQQFITL